VGGSGRPLPLRIGELPGGAGGSRDGGDGGDGVRAARRGARLGDRDAPPQGAGAAGRGDAAGVQAGDGDRRGGAPRPPRGTGTAPRAARPTRGRPSHGGAMKANCWMGVRKVEVREVPDPRILNERDAIVKVSSTAICGSDLHLYNGFLPTMERGDVLGHEFM